MKFIIGPTINLKDTEVELVRSTVNNRPPQKL